MKKLYKLPRLKIITGLGVMLFMTISSFAQYCIPAYTTGTVEGDYIGYVGLGTIDNATDGAPSPFYTDYTALSTDIEPGMSYTITLGCGSYTSNNDIAAWIDYNGDGDFADAGELAATVVDLTAFATGTATFTVPFDAVGGPTTMRIREIYAMPVTPDPCATYSYGETEDYGINILGGAANDVGIIDVTAPITGAALGMENVVVTIRNYGSSEASEFNVEYQVDGGTITIEPFLGSIPAFSTASFTFADSYDFTADGCYSITAWTEMEIDENTDNDDYTESVCNICAPANDIYYIYSNVYGGAEPWFTTTNSTAMNTAFGVGGWTQAFFETVDVATLFSDATGLIYLDGSDAFANELETFLTTNASALENWVAAGGRLFLNSAPNEGDGMSFGFAGVDLIYPYFTSNASAVDDSHPVFNGPYTPITTEYTGTSFAHALVSGGGVSGIIEDAFTPGNYVCAEKFWGAGLVVFGGMTTTNFHSPLVEAANLRANILSYVACADVVAPGCTPVAPGGLYVDGITTNDAVLHWDAVDGADQYRLVLQNTATGLIAKRGVNTTTYSLIDNLDPLTTYAFRVKTVCYDEGAISSPSEWMYWTTLGRLGATDATVSLYPNPNNGVFTLNIAGYENNDFEMFVYDAIGKVVYQKSISVSNNNFTDYISLDQLSSGMYQVKLVNSEYQLSYPVMIQK